uniref:Uncharacterized protein n=1 Tax=Solanum tuberosum TaxID=4113 RepID=M1CCX9_SOLTU
MWNSKLHTQGVCTSTRYGESKEGKPFLPFVPVKILPLGLTKPQKPAHGERIAQVHLTIHQSIIPSMWDSNPL